MDFLNLPDLGGGVFTILAFIVALSIIVAIHEYGHYIVGRWSGIHAEVFSLGFGPVIYSRVDKRGTKWQLALLPLGGYVKFLGDANAAGVGQVETSDVDRRRTMMGAPLWARAATVAAGPIFNFILAGIIFTAVIMGQGQAADPIRVEALDPLPDAYQVALEPGDQLVSVEGQAISGLEDMSAALGAAPERQVLTYTVLRDGAEVDVTGPWPYPPSVDGLNPGSAAYDADLRQGDVITAIDGAPIFRFQQIVDAVTASEGTPLVFTIWRDGTETDFTIAPRSVDLPTGDGGFERRWLIGISGGLFFDLVTETPSPWEATKLGTVQVWDILQSSVSGLYHMIAGSISSCNLSGPVGIAQAAGAMASQGGTSFIWFVAVLSAAVGLLNLFPVPILDGGHLVFHAYEAISGRPPSDRALRILMAGGLAVILTLMLFALANDLFLCP